MEVTKEWLAGKVLANPNFVIGRALLAIYNNQTSSEQSQTVTRVQNGIGFSKPDARIGSIGARMFKAHGKIEPWVQAIWLKVAKDKLPRICKYASQLQMIAQENCGHLYSRSIAEDQRNRKCILCGKPEPKPEFRQLDEYYDRNLGPNVI